MASLLIVVVVLAVATLATGILLPLLGGDRTSEPDARRRRDEELSNQLAAWILRPPLSRAARRW